jgi:hypothetical protein
MLIITFRNVQRRAECQKMRPIQPNRPLLREFDARRSREAKEV